MTSELEPTTTPLKKNYETPILTMYGKLKDLTTGGSGRAQEPSNGSKTRP